VVAKAADGMEIPEVMLRQQKEVGVIVIRIEKGD